MWELGMRSKQLWDTLAEGIEEQGFSPLQELGWKKTGSLMIGCCPASGSWSGSLMKNVIEKPNIVLDVPVKPLAMKWSFACD
ncbi:hypothetical protein IFM89_001544 [Coptis chinensis]|uniref:Uncharacterized protein n=1 Tax=Coptis chinensis TaxID=261450 RepID=A0A835LHE2_9MAGN|nr:hypothetical protein IFM89_001544 [Coptis chinensis]